MNERVQVGNKVRKQSTEGFLQKEPSGQYSCCGLMGCVGMGSEPACQERVRTDVLLVV